MDSEQTNGLQDDAAFSGGGSGERGGGGGGTDAPRRRWQRTTIFFTCGLAVAAVLAFVLFGNAGTSSSTATAVEPGISKAAATLLQFSPLKGKNGFPARNFTLTDQYGKSTSLKQFQGKAVLLAFNDDRCPNLCTLYAQSVVTADRDLGSARKHVVFLSVNVNPFYPQVRYVKTWTDSHGLGGEPNWYFTTGTVSQLKAVWKLYGTYVQETATNKTVDHGTQLFFINTHGQMRGVSSFDTNAANTALYGHDVAQMANDLLPTSEQVSVRGPTTKSPTLANAAVGSPAPKFTLPSLGSGSGSVSLSKLRGRYVVVNFWSSACTACVPELPHIEAAYRRFGSHVAFVGVDVSDTAKRARAAAAKAGVTYPLVSDSSGSAAGAYQPPGLPFTAFISPTGKLLIRHPGAMTVQQLEYILLTLDPKLGPKPAG